MIARHRVVFCLLAALVGNSVQAQTVPPPHAIPPPQVIDTSRPHLLNDRLDLSRCEYPIAARRARLEGCCRMSVTIGADAIPRAATGQCTDPVFLLPSQACLTAQEYRPALKKGRPVAGKGDVVVSFRLEKQTQSPLEKALGLFTHAPAQPAGSSPANDDFCKRQPDDLIASLARHNG